MVIDQDGDTVPAPRAAHSVRPGRDDALCFFRSAKDRNRTGTIWNVGPIAKRATGNTGWKCLGLGTVGYVCLGPVDVEVPIFTGPGVREKGNERREW